LKKMIAGNSLKIVSLRKKMDEDDIKKRVLYGQAWKNLPEDLKQELRTSWKALDALCNKHQGTPRLIESIVDKGRYIKGCQLEDEYHYPTAEEHFVQMVKGVEDELKLRMTEYAVNATHPHGEFHYETDNDWHHIRLLDNDNYEDDTSEITFEKHHRTGPGYEDKFLSSGIQNYVTRMNRIRETKKEYNIQQMLELANKLEKQKFKGVGTEAERLEYNIESFRLAEQVRKYFEV